MVCHLTPLNVRTNSLWDAVCREMDGFVERLQESEPANACRGFLPRTNIAETDKQYEITLDLPGLKPDEFELEVHDGHLTVSGTRKGETEEEGKTFHRVERFHGEFRRRFVLGQDVEPDKVEAEYRDGVLRILVPKTEEVQPRKIEIKS